MIWTTAVWCARFVSYCAQRWIGLKPVPSGLIKICVTRRAATRTVDARLAVTCHCRKHAQPIMYHETFVVVDADRSADAIWPVNVRIFVPTGCNDIELYCDVPALRKDAELKVNNVHAGWNDYVLFMKDKSND